ncbi:cyanophycin synthetase [Rhizobium herbae]|uniref:Cyanophycin synthetase n=1 Tax=Rhizobium herbae TaxID=508661 RepID=A0ABS7HB57_9HYPH|nr:cyanophycin synthetase [Rhizobium herbae]MBW9064388.1 cyanophycin synthetase [Rhizobium herbae]
MRQHTALRHRRVGYQSLHVLETAVYRGPHLYSRTPMIRLRLGLGLFELLPTSRLPDFPTQLLDQLPGLAEHGCSYGKPGGFVSRMREGTWLGHVAEHVALELQCIVGAKVSRGKTRSVRGLTGVYDVMYAYQDEEVGRLAGRFSLELLQSLLPPGLAPFDRLDRVAPTPLGHFDLGSAIEHLRALQAGRALGLTTASLVQEAECRGIPWSRTDNSSLIQFGYGKYQKRIRASCTSLTSEVATEIACDKQLTNKLLSEAGIPVPEGKIVSTGDEAIAAAIQIGFPVVAKPVDGNHGRGVNANLDDVDEVRWAFEQARREGEEVLVERHFSGNDYRILVIGGEVVAVAERSPAHVIGDGKSTIQGLIERENNDPRRGFGHEAPLTKIKVDDCLLHHLGRQNLGLSSVLARGQVVFLRPTANLSSGGTAVDRTEDIHPDNALVARRAAKIVGLDIAGIDFIAPDISRSIHHTGGGVIEVNAGPGFRMHLQPSEGRSRNVAGAALDLLFPAGAPSRIPIFAITGTNGKTTTAKMLAHILAGCGAKVGLTSSTGAYLDGERIIAGDCSGPKSARLVLRDPDIDVAVLETARGGILREGLGFDRCDFGCVLNIGTDHLGQCGIETLEDLAKVKSVVVEAVSDQGWSILNADDPLTAAMADVAGGQICYISLLAKSEWPAFLTEHVANGGRAVSCHGDAEDGCNITLYDGGQALFVANTIDFPATVGGLAAFNVQNAMAAVALAYSSGVSLPVIRSGLSTFRTTFEQSPGRLNILEAHGFKVIVDYAHNPDGLRALGQLVDKLRSRHRRAIGLVGIAGDRRNEDIRAMGALATSFFDKVVFKEDADRRGREAGEAASLLHEGARTMGAQSTDVSVVLSEEEAVDYCLRFALPDDLVVLTASDVGSVWRQVCAFAAAPLPMGSGSAARLERAG